MRYGLPAVERAMKMQEIVLRAMSGTITWLQAADILGLSPRTVRRWRARYERQGYDGLLDRRGRQPSPRRVPLAEVERVLRLYRERYLGVNVRHFLEIARREHGVTLSYSFVRQALQGAGLVGQAPAARPPSAAPGAAGVCRRAAAPRWQSACVAGPGAGRAPDADRRGGRCDHAGALCPARGCREHRDGHGRVASRLCRVRLADSARYRPGGLGVLHAHGGRRVPRDPVSAFVALGPVDLDQILCHEDERTVAKDNTVVLDGVRLQVPKQPGRTSCEGLRVLVRRHLTGEHTVWWGTRLLGRYATSPQEKRRKRTDHLSNQPVTFTC